MIKFLRSAIFMAIAFLLSSPAHADFTNPLYKSGYEYYKKNDCISAIKNFRIYLEIDKKFLEEDHNRKLNVTTAIENCEKMLKKYPSLQTITS